VGDIGIIVDILEAPDGTIGFVVERSGPDGVSIWLSDFTEEELEPVSDDDGPPTG
jgi:hypothetical protein